MARKYYPDDAEGFGGYLLDEEEYAQLMECVHYLPLLRRLAEADKVPVVTDKVTIQTLAPS